MYLGLKNELECTAQTQVNECHAVALINGRHFPPTAASIALSCLYLGDAEVNSRRTLRVLQSEL